MCSCNDPVLAGHSLELGELVYYISFLFFVSVEAVGEGLLFSVCVQTATLRWLSIVILLLEVPRKFGDLYVIILFVRQVNVPESVLFLRVVKVAKVWIILHISLDIMLS